MSYYDPLYPAYEATRHQIQKTIYSLEDKLRRRKQLDLLIEKEFVQKQMIQRQRELITTDYAISQIAAQHDLRESLRKLRMYDIPNYGIYPDLDQEKKLIELDYLDRLNALKKQKQLLYRDNKQYDNYSRVKSNTKQVKVDNNDDEILVKKYQDGTKLNEYNNQLQASNSKVNSHTDRYVSVKKQNFTNQKVNYENQTPFDKLKSSQYSSLQNNQNNNNQDKKMEPMYNNSKKKLYKEELEGQIKKYQQQDLKKFQHSEDNIRVQQMKQMVKSRNNHSVSPTKSSRSHAKSNNDTKRLHRSRLNDLSKVTTLQESALKKIQNRLIVSSVIYEDSKYKNIKHQLSHLHSTYENQLKMRKDIKDKINTHPMILRKHAMVARD